MRAQIGFLLLVVACGRGKPEPAAPPPPEVGVVTLQPNPVTVYEPYVGQVAAPQTIEIRPQVSGTIERQVFADGDQVKEDDLLYVIDQRPFRATLAQARANLAGAESTRTNADLVRERTEKLAKTDAASRSEADAAAAGAGTASASVGAAEAAVRAAEIDLGFTRVRAPASGGTSLSLVRAGDLVTPQTTLVTLFAGTATNVYFAVDPGTLPSVLAIASRDAAGQAPPPGDPPGEPPGEPTPPASIPAFHLLGPDGQPYRYPARLESVDSSVDPKTGTMQVRLVVQNQDRELKPGEFIRVQVPVAFAPAGLLVPQQAVQELQGTQSVLVVDASGMAQSRRIVAQHRVGQDWLVASGLAPGEMVIAEGTAKAQPGKPVKAVPASNR